MKKIKLWNTGTRPVIYDRRFHKVIQPNRFEMVPESVAKDLLKRDSITDKDPAIPKAKPKKKGEDVDRSND